ncbi:MAG: EAL domain-containing protein [Bacillota bacterium]|nr:EAL domain-containing protein [Bacillota bacterium]
MLNSHVKFHSTSGKRLVLIVDDEQINREMLRHIVEQEFSTITASNGSEALDIIREKADFLSLVLLDLRMPELDGFEVMRKMKEDDNLSQIPIIVLTSDESAEVDCLKLGASDFITKPFSVPEVILTRMQKTIELYEDRTIIQSTEREELTGLFTKQYFYRYADQFDKFHPELVMDAVYLDINHFHLINELHGRNTGDAVLLHLSSYLKTLREKTNCIVSRFDADKFFVYIEHGKVEYSKVIEDLNRHFEEFRDQHVRVRCGIYMRSDKALSIETRFDRAIQASHAIKNNYSRFIAYYDASLHEDTIYADRLINEIDEAIATNQFYLNFQPKYNVQGEEPVLTSAEVLVRWEHPELGRISPGMFIPIFEKNGLIQRLDFHIWEVALEAAGRWKRELGLEIPLSVNISRIDLYSNALIDYLIEKLMRNNLKRENLYLEITESAYMDDAEQLIEVVDQLRSEGFKIEMDDFGSGYSSLNMLADVSVDVLKMDMRFIQNIKSNKKQETMIKLVMDIAKYLGIHVIAEGVEDKVQVDFLKSVGCDIIQGYYFSKPLPEDDFVQLLMEQKK